MLTNITSVNSTGIKCSWHPSPSTEDFILGHVGINLGQLEGLFTNGFYASTRSTSKSSIIINDMFRLNETNQEILTGFDPDTIYHACYESKWYEPNTTINPFNFDGLYRQQCQLVRTYMADQTTLNPIPILGQYSWTHKMTNNETLSIVINASISSELPYYSRNITVKLDSTIQSQEFSTPTESVQFEFRGLDLGSKTYLVVLNFSLISDPTTNIHTVTNIINGTITTTLAPGMGNRFSTWNFLPLLLVSLAILLPLW